MNGTLEHNEYLQILIGQSVGTILLCIFGGILNAIMMYMLLHKKQARSQVHTIYMVQIALTDLLVCAMWLIMTSVIARNIFQIPWQDEETSDEYAAGGANLSGPNATSPIDFIDTEKQWIFMHAWYNFYYYVNIFLLASMSVERCAAVWKSMRCQRYQYNRKVIIGISVTMWIIALTFVLPEMINPELIAEESDSPNGFTRVMNLGQKEDSTNYTELGLPQWTNLNASSATSRPYDQYRKNYQADMNVLFACNTLLEKARRDESDCVTSYGKVDLHLCFGEFVSIMDRYVPLELPADDLPSDEEYGSDYDAGDDYFATLCPNADDDDIHMKTFSTELYHAMLQNTFEEVEKHFQQYGGMQSACFPNMSRPARIYVIVVNLILGFFVPFSIIVFSYVSIACLIGKRVRSRMNLTLSETSTTHFPPNQSTSDGNTMGPIQMRDKKTRRASRNDSMSRRISDFMRYSLLRKQHDGLENRSYMTDSDQHALQSNTSPKAPQSSQPQRYDVSSHHDSVTQHPKQSETDRQSSEDDPLHDPEFEEAIRQAGPVRMRTGGSRIKYPSSYDTTNDNIPQTIEEHPHEEGGEEEELLRASNGSSISQHSMRATPPHRLTHRNSASRRESGGSYGSSTMESMATDQTSLAPYIDKRYSSATTSALTPPTPKETNPHANQFFPTGEDIAMHSRTPSGEGSYTFGSGLNDVTRQLYVKSMQRKQGEEAGTDGRISNGVDGQADLADNGLQNRNGTSKERYSHPRTRGHNTQEERTSSTWLPSRSTCRLIPENQLESEYYKQNHIYRQCSSSSTNQQQRRFSSSSSKRSTAGSHHSSSKKKNIVHKNAEKQLRVSRTLLTYVIVFALCWLPQRIAYLLYIIEALVGTLGLTCVKLMTGVRILSFISVILNPAVYILTQRQFQEYVRKSACIKSLRRWYAKCFKSTSRSPDANLDSRFPISSDRNDEGCIQMKPVREDRYQMPHQGVNTKQTSYRMQTQTRAAIHSKTGAVQHDVFPPPAMRHCDATIDEMKEEEAAAEESLEKEMKRLAVEEEKRRKDDINRNFMESSEDDILSNKTGSGSGNKTTSSSTKSENFEELWKRWLQSGGARIQNLSSNNVDSVAGMESEFDNIDSVPKKIPMPNGSVERGILE